VTRPRRADAGIEPDPGQSTNRLMAHDFRRKTLIPSRFSPSIESPGAPTCPLESTPVVEISWRRCPLVLQILPTPLGVSEHPLEHLCLGLAVIKCVVGLCRGPIERRTTPSASSRSPYLRRAPPSGDPRSLISLPRSALALCSPPRMLFARPASGWGHPSHTTWPR
jgi:hypothetical protein